MIFYQEYFNAIRQVPAISFVLLAYSFLFRREIIKGVLCIIIASGFHLSAWFSLLIVIVYIVTQRKEYHFTGYLFISTIGIIIILTTPWIFDLLISIFPKYSTYEIDSNWSGIGWIANIIILVPAYCLIAMKFSDKEVSVYRDNKYRCLVILSIAFIILLVGRLYSNWFFRIAFYYEIALIILCSYRNNEKVINIFSNMLLIYFVIYFIYLNCINNSVTSALLNYAVFH